MTPGVLAGLYRGLVVGKDQRIGVHIGKGVFLGQYLVESSVNPY